MTITDIDLLALPAGELFVARDGNGERVDDARWPADDEDTKFVLDSVGNEVRDGDYLLVLDEYPHWHQYRGKVVRATGVRRADMYPADGSMRTGWLHRTAEPSHRVIRPWSPSASINGVEITMHGSSTSINPKWLRKVNMTEQETLRLQLAEMYDERSKLDASAAVIEAKRAVLNIRIREQRMALGEIE